MPRTVSTCVLAVAALLVAVPAAAPSTSGPQAGAARGCNIRGQQDNLGTTYVTTLRVSGTTCDNGKKVVRAYHACRHKSGGKGGRCRSRIFGYSCSERRLSQSRVQYDARARCKKSGREVFQVYTQNL